MANDKTLVSIRLSDEDIAELDAEAKRLAATVPGMRAKRTHALRVAVELGLRDIRDARGESR